MQRHLESSAPLGRFDPVWVAAHERLISQQRLRSNYEVGGRPWWLGAFYLKARTAHEEAEASA
jgi:hypothetical protein